MAAHRTAWFSPEEYAKYSVADRLQSVPARIRPVAHATPADAEAQQPLPPSHMLPGLLQPAMSTMDPAAMIAAAVAPYIAAQFGQLLPQPPMAWPYGPMGGAWPPALFAQPLMQSPQPQVAVPVHSECTSHDPAGASTSTALATVGGAPPRTAPDTALRVGWHGAAAHGKLTAGGGRGGTAPSGVAEPGNELWGSDEEDDAPTAMDGGVCAGGEAVGAAREGWAEEEDEVMDEGGAEQDMEQEMGVHEDGQGAADDGFEGQEGAPGQEVEEVAEEEEEEWEEEQGAAETAAAEAEESRREARGAAGAVLRGRYEQIDASRKRRQCVPVPCTHTARALHAHRTHTARALRAHCMRTACTLHMLCTYQVRARAFGSRGLTRQAPHHRHRHYRRRHHRRHHRCRHQRHHRCQRYHRCCHRHCHSDRWRRRSRQCRSRSSLH